MNLYPDKNRLKLFTELIDDISLARDENSKTHCLIKYFESGDSSTNKDEALNLLIGNYPKKIISPKQLKNWAPKLTGYPNLLIERSEKEVGNFINSLALLLKTKHFNKTNQSILYWLSEFSRRSKFLEYEIKNFVKKELAFTEADQRKLILKLLTGVFKTPIQVKALIKCFSQILNLAPALLSLRFYENKRKKLITLNDLGKSVDGENRKIPSPFPKKVLLEKSLELIGICENWEAFGSREGIEVQLIKYDKTLYLWTSEFEIISDKFPEIISSCEQVNVDFVIHGQILPGNHEPTLELLQNRINKKTIASKDLQMAKPLFSIWNILDFGGKAAMNNNELLKNHFSKQSNFESGKNIELSSWDELISVHQKCRQSGFSGIIKKKAQTDQYYFWKANSYTINAMLMYVELDSMGNSGIKSMTFGLKHEDKIIPIGKTTHSLNSNDSIALMTFIRENTTERFGSVRTLKPSLVHELYFDSINSSNRRKSGLALSNVTINRNIGNDPILADSLDSLKVLGIINFVGSKEKIKIGAK